MKNDVYTWRYTDEYTNTRQDSVREGTLYWCMSNIAIEKEDGKLVDTYWYTRDEVNRDNVELTFLGNLDDYEKANEYEERYYSDEDIMNLNHSNNGRDNFYLKKGAERCVKKIRQSILNKLEKMEHERDWANREIERLLESDIEKVYL